MKNWEKLKNNPKGWEIFRTRMLIIKAIREFFWKKGFLEVESPLLSPGLILESTISHFETNLIDCHGREKIMFLTSSPEAYHKKLLAVGSGNIFEITKSFRNGEDGMENHNSEFTLLEYYRVGVDYRGVMKECEELLNYINFQFSIFNFQSNSNNKIQNDKKIRYKNIIINLISPWKRISVLEAWEKYVGIPFYELYNNKTKSYPLDKIIKVSRKLGYKVDINNNWEELFNQIFLNEIEPNLLEDGQPFILYDYPTPLAALAKVKDSDPRFAERFEFYIGGLELGDCYTELTDYSEQLKRFEDEKQAIKLKKHTDNIPDTDYLKALKMGMPECSGIAIGIDRLVMLFTDVKSISEVMLFPNMQK